jgi:hypothetical protein
MWTLKDLITALNGWKRNASRGMISKADLAIAFAWNYERVNEELLADALGYYLLETECTTVKEFVNQTLFGDE